MPARAFSRTARRALRAPCRLAPIPAPSLPAAPTHPDRSPVPEWPA